MIKKDYDCAIIGMGPGGITAAIYLKRFNIDIICFEKNSIASKVSKLNEVDNYPGIFGSGENLAKHFIEQVQQNEIPVVNSSVQIIQKNDDLFVIQTDEGFYNAKSVIVCTGIREKEFKIPGEDSFEKRGISRCAICDGALYRRRDIAVYGHKNTAVIEANYLLDISPKVYFIADSKLDSDESETALMKKHSNLVLLENYKIIEAKGNFALESLVLKNNETNEEKEIKVSGLFLYVGNSTSTQFLPFPDIFDEKGFIEVDDKQETKIPGLFAVGDVTNSILKQIVVAAGDGAKASLGVKKYLQGK